MCVVDKENRFYLSLWNVVPWLNLFVVVATLTSCISLKKLCVEEDFSLSHLFGC